MLSKAKHPSGETLTINATGIPHCVRNDKFPVKAGRATIVYTSHFSDWGQATRQLDANKLMTSYKDNAYM